MIKMQEDLFSTLWLNLRQNMGLSEYEARIYVSLILHGPSKASDISNECGVPRTKVYQILKKLCDEGLATRISGNPAKFAQESPVEAFGSYINSFEKKVRELNWVISMLKDRYEKTKNHVKIDKVEMWIFQGQKDILEKTREMLYSAKKIISIVTSGANLVLVYRFFNKIFDELLKKGVKIQIFTSIDSYNKNIARELSYICQVQHVDIKLPILMVFANGTKLLLAKFPTESSLRETKESANAFGVFSDNMSLYNLLSETFQAFYSHFWHIEEKEDMLGKDISKSKMKVINS